MASKIDSELKSAAVLQQMQQHLQSDAGKEILAKIGFIYQFVIAPKKLGKDDEMFVVDLKNGKVYQGAYDGKPDATFSFVDDDFVALSSGKLNPQMAFIRGKMKIKGSMSAAQKFTPDIFPKPAKL
ncbi:hypothetical protein KP509_22G017700 [Ceratopteris richardii]|uniref:SCP2 domain-containing protein n=1 Tax=Ceratopteris richardii TaxID=49495 RepID=A0A8T2S5P0_CERRI|nr:hypothetical protein KP509_22G017700 [Ceratopteris richardii]